jgi:hypothetical protein
MHSTTRFLCVSRISVKDTDCAYFYWTLQSNFQEFQANNATSVGLLKWLTDNDHVFRVILSYNFASKKNRSTAVTICKQPCRHGYLGLRNRQWLSLRKFTDVRILLLRTLLTAVTHPQKLKALLLRFKTASPESLGFRTASPETFKVQDRVGLVSVIFKPHGIPILIHRDRLLRMGEWWPGEYCLREVVIGGSLDRGSNILQPRSPIPCWAANS